MWIQWWWWLHNHWSKMGMCITNWVNILCYKDKLWKSMVTVHRLPKWIYKLNYSNCKNPWCPRWKYKVKFNHWDSAIFVSPSIHPDSRWKWNFTQSPTKNHPVSAPQCYSWSAVCNLLYTTLVLLCWNNLCSMWSCYCMSKFAHAEGPSNIMQFLETMYPTEESCPDYLRWQSLSGAES